MFLNIKNMLFVSCKIDSILLNPNTSSMVPGKMTQWSRERVKEIKTNPTQPLVEFLFFLVVYVYIASSDPFFHETSPRIKVHTT